jgi:hypothetical protein
MQLFLKISHLLDTIEFPKTLASNPRGSKLKGHFLNTLVKKHPFKYQVFRVIYTNSILNCISCSMTNQIRLCSIGVLFVCVLIGCQSQKITRYGHKYGRLKSTGEVTTTSQTTITRNDSSFSVKRIVDSNGLKLASRVYFRNQLYSDTFYYQGKWVSHIGRFQPSTNAALCIYGSSNITYYDKKGNSLWLAREKCNNTDNYTRIQYYDRRNKLLPARYAYPQTLE